MDVSSRPVFIPQNQHKMIQFDNICISTLSCPCKIHLPAEYLSRISIRTAMQIASWKCGQARSHLMIPL